MKTLLAFSFILTALISAPSLANTPSIYVPGHGHVDSSFGAISSPTVPSGLQNKATPHGLQMQNKTPKGWSKGQKGWKGKRSKKIKHHHFNKNN